MRVLRLESSKDRRCGIYRLLGGTTERYTARPSFHCEFAERCTTLAKDTKLLSNFLPFGQLDFEDYHCGFANLEQLFNWFPKNKLDELSEEASDIVTLAVYEIDERLVAVGNAQVLFALKYAQKIKNLDPAACNDEDCLTD